MEDIELKNMWRSYDQQLQEAKILNLQSWAVNIKTFEYLQSHKAHAKLASLARFKTRAVIIGIAWALFLGVLLYGNHFTNGWFSFSVLALFLFAVYAVALYIRQIMLISRINFSEPVVAAQKKIPQLQAATLRTVRVLWWQLPFYTTFYWSTEWIKHDYLFWLIAFPVCLLLIILAAWLYINLNPANAHKKWFKVIMGKKEWLSVIEAKQYLDEIEAFKNE